MKRLRAILAVCVILMLCMVVPVQANARIRHNYVEKGYDIDPTDSINQALKQYGGTGEDFLKDKDIGPDSKKKLKTHAYTPNRGSRKPKTYGGLRISKTVQSDSDADYIPRFEFTVTLKDKDGHRKHGKYSWSRTGNRPDSSESGKLKSGGSVMLTEGETVKVRDIPAGTRYSVKETPGNSYKLLKKKGASGTIDKDKTSKVKFLNKRLPDNTAKQTQAKARNQSRNQKRDQNPQGQAFAVTVGAILVAMVLAGVILSRKRD